MGIQDFTALFNNLDTACKGFVTTEQILDFHQSIYFSPVAVEHVDGAIQRVCGTPGTVDRSHFIEVLEELQRRQSIEEQSYWDFQALDYNGTNRICLKDALLLFREFHQERFSMYTWHQFLDSRAVPGADVYFDEIRFWLCDYPQGEPATLEQITKEEARLERIQGQHDLDGYNAYKILQDDGTEFQEYQDEMQHHMKRRMNKWKKQGLEAMLFDDGLEVEDLESQDASKDHVTINDIMDAMETKYELLREKLLLEMARLSSAVEGDQSEIYQELCKKERQLRRSGALESEVHSLSGSRIPLPHTLLGIMGNVQTVDKKQKEEAERHIKELEMQGRFRDEIGKIIMSEYMDSVDGDSTCGATLVKINTRYLDEKEAVLSIIKDKGGQIQVITMEANRLSRQHLLITEEAEFQPCALAVGLAERPQSYKSSRLTDWDRLRSENLAKFRLQAKKGRKQIKSPQNYCDLDHMEEMGVVDLQKKLVVELVEKHKYEREATIQMLQGRDSENSKAVAKSITAGERNKLLKTLRNRHTNWKNSKSDNSEVLHSILLEGMGLYYENRKVELQELQTKVSEDDTNEAVLADLQQRQEGEFQNVMEDIYHKTKDELVKVIFTTNRQRIEEHFDNVAFVVLGTIEISEGDKEYTKALEEKYDALRDKVLLMGLRDEMKGEWRRMTEKERRKELKDRRKQEKRLRGTGSVGEMGDLIGLKHKAKMLPTLRKLMGEERGEFEARFMKQKATGQVLDETSKGSFDPVNVLADLIPRYDEELDALVMWLNSPQTKSLNIKQQRIKMLQLKLESCAAEMEEDFEVAAMFVGLLERVLASLHGRHATDNVRQRDLAKRRTQLRGQRLQQNEGYEKRLITTHDPPHGDTTGWQLSYLREVLVRHEEERENLLHFLQDDSMEDLKEAAAMMSEQESKSRLAELHAKRRRLNLSNEDDQDEHTSILEEAVAIRAVCKRREILAETRREPSKDDVIISVLKELQEEQDKEIAGILENIVDLKEDELQDLRTEEKDKRANKTLPNVFIVLTQSESKTYEQELIKALHKKYESVQTKILVDCLIHKHGETAWVKMGEKEKQSHIQELTQKVDSFRKEGNNVGLIEVLEGFHLDKTLISIIGIPRFHFLELSRHTEEDLISEPAEEEQIMKNPLLNLWLRFESEKKNLLQKLKGLQEEYMSEREQQICIVRITRETLLCSHDHRFSISATLVGVAERQMVDGKPRMVGDKARYERLSKHRLTTENKKITSKDQIIRDQNLVIQMNAVIEFLDFKHQTEQDQFKLLVEMTVDQKLHQEVMMMSQQQRKDQLSRLQSKRDALPIEKQKEHDGILYEGMVIKRELCRQRMSSDQKKEATDKDIHEALMAELFLTQNREAERLLQEFMSKENEELQKMQLAQINDRKQNSRENVAYIVFSPEMCLEVSTDTDLMEALEGKYDALRDKLLAEALIKQLGESEWQRLTDLERQKKMMELKLKERKLRREGKFDEISQILGDALENQETLKRLMGENKEEQQRKLRERLERKKKRLAQGMSEEECEELERKEIEEEEEEERKQRRNILLDLEHRFEKEKEELLRQIGQGDDRLAKEKARQLQLLKLKREERKARNEDKFDSAALVLGLAEENKKKQQEATEEEKLRQQRLAKERIEAARRRRREGKTTPEEAINHETDDRVELQESLNMAVDRRHRHERDLLIQLLDDASTSEMKQKAEGMTEEERQDKLYELAELRKHWRQADNRDPKEQMKILQEAACYLIQSELHKQQEEGLTKTEEEVKVHILSNLQMWQDAEAAMILSNLEEKDIGTLQQMVKMQSMVEEEGLHDNVSHVLLNQSKGDKSEDGEQELLEALEQKYDALKDKLIEAALKEEMGEDEWNKLSDSEKQKKIVELKMKERKLRQEGNVEEAAAIFEKVLENDELLDQILGPEDEKEAEKRREELIRQREEQGLPTDEESINRILEEQKKEHGKQRRINVLENLNIMLEDEKAKLLKALRSQHNRIDQERERQLAIARLQHERRKLAREEKFESAAIIVSQAREREEKHKQSIKEQRERSKALARERLEARRRKQQQKKEEISEEQRLRTEDEMEQLEDMVQPNSTERSAVQTAILETLDQRQMEERNVLMDITQTARNSAAMIREAKKMSTQDLKTQLLKLEKDERNWKQDSMAAALHVDEGKMSKAEKGKMFKEIAQRRNEHQAILVEAMVYKLQLEEQSHKAQNPDMSDEERAEDMSVALLADLQEKQTTENSTVQNLLHDMEDKDLQEVKRVQRIAKREGWFDSLTGMLFQLSGADLAGEEGSLEVLDKTMEDIEENMRKEREELIAEAKAENATEEDLQQALKQLEHEQELKRKAMTADLEQQRKKLMEKVAARKRQTEEKESKEIKAAQLILLSESRQKKQKESAEKERSQQSSELQKRLEARRQARKKATEDQDENRRSLTDEERFSGSSDGSRPNTMDSNPFASMKREKTALDVTVSDKEKHDTYTKLMREQTAVMQHKQESQRKQEEMLKRRLAERQSKKQAEVQSLLNLGERQKTSLLAAKQDEKDKQLERMKERIKRERSRSPGKKKHAAIEETDLKSTMKK